MLWQSLSLPAICLSLLRQHVLTTGVCGEPEDVTSIPESSDVADRCLLQMSDRRQHAGSSQHRETRVVEEDSSKPAQHSEKSMLSKSRSHLDKISVDVFYQFQCPHCVEFLTNELQKVWEDVELQPALEINLYPEDFPMECCREGDSGCLGSQKGLNSCLGARVELCAGDILKDNARHVPFVLCIAAQGHRANVETTSKECAEKHGVDLEEIRTCVNSKRGFDLMLSVGEKSMKVNSEFIPWVMVNGQHATNNALLPALCEQFESGLWLWEKRPNACLTVGESLTEDASKGGCDPKHPCLFTESTNDNTPPPF